MTITKLYIEADLGSDPLVRRIRRRLALADVETVSCAEEVYRLIGDAPRPIDTAKKILYLTRNRGAFLRKCPGTRSYTCCDYMILHVGTFCTMDCTYCILQAYFHPPVLQFFVNHDALCEELDRYFQTGEHVRIGTGEYTDSMIWEPWTELSDLLVPRFGAQNRCVLELKTKTVAIERLASLPHNRRTILAWSLNTESVIRDQERGTASLAARLAAARRVAAWGYPVAFHFDPMVIDGPDTAARYAAVVDALFSHVPAQDIAWISLGAFRFMPELKPIVEARFPDSRIPYGEFVTGEDGKMRYFKPLRIDLYRQVARRIKRHAPEAAVYFCMEDEEVWQASLGFTPEERGGLPAMLDEAARRVCRLGGSSGKRRPSR